MGATGVMERWGRMSPRLKARLAGAFYLVIFVVAPTGARTATPARMAINLLSDTAVALLFYELFKPVSKRGSLLAALFRLAFVAMMAAISLSYFGYLPLLGPAHLASAFNRGDEMSLVPFGVHCLLIGWLIVKSKFLPRILGVLVALAGVGWLTFLWPPLAHALYPYVLAPGIVGEGALTLWLLVAGVDGVRWNEQNGEAWRR